MARDDTALWAARDAGDEAARAKLVELYLHLVVQTRQRQFSKVPWDLGEELVGEGRLMLVRCVDEFDLSYKVKFQTYAIIRLRGAMTETLRRADWTPRSERQKESRGEDALIYAILSLEQSFSGDVGLDGEALTFVETIVAPDDVSGSAILHMEGDVLQDMIDQLHPLKQRILRDHFWGDETYVVIAARENRSESRVHQLARDAQQHLKEMILARPQ